MQISAEEVAMTQAFVESISDIFQTMTGFLKLIGEREESNLDDEYLLNLNEGLIQTLNVFGATCHHYKNDKRLMKIGKEQMHKKWDELSKKDKALSLNYGKFMELALEGRKMNLVPLIEKSEEQYKNDINAESVNGAYGQLIGGRCAVNKRAQQVRDDPQKYDQEHAKMYKSKSWDNSKRLNENNYYVQPSPHDMISNSIKGKKERHFDHGYNNEEMDIDHEDCKDETNNMTNVCLSKMMKLTGNGNNDKIHLKANTPAKIQFDHGKSKDVKFAIPFQNAVLSKVPNSFLIFDAKMVKNAERNHILANGHMGYDSLLGSDKQTMLIQQYDKTQRMIFGTGLKY
jgi:hypothetical protein